MEVGGCSGASTEDCPPTRYIYILRCIGAEATPVSDDRENEYRQMKFALHRRKEDGLAVLVIFILMSLMTALVISNSICLHYLRRDIMLIQNKHLSKLERVSVAVYENNNIPISTTDKSNHTRVGD